MCFDVLFIYVAQRLFNVKDLFSKCLCNFDECNQHKFLRLKFFCQFWTSLLYYVVTKFIEIVSIISIFVQPQNLNLSPI
jgi:hypothetical protein